MVRVRTFVSVTCLVCVESRSDGSALKVAEEEITAGGSTIEAEMDEEGRCG